MKIKSKAPWIYMAVIMVITYIPIVLTVVYSFNESKITSIWGGFSLTWYEQLFRDRDLAEALRNSLVLAGLSCLSAVVIGTTGAIGMDRWKNRFNSVVSYFSLIPIMIPEIILGMVFLAAFSLMNLPFGMLTLVIAHTTFCVPYVFMTVRARLAGMDHSTEEAARDLGATGLRTFWDITLPALLPAIWSGVLLSFAMSFDDVVISIFVTGATVNTLPIKIYTRMKTGVTPEINALATVLLAATIAILLLAGALGSQRGRAGKKEEELRR
ncbi:MAG: ABC transporter permease [Eubacteriales bacterium]|nr:ABC transporter permease [Eubacteriales bacterium]